MDTSDCGAAQAGIALAAALLDSAVFHQVFVELLEITGGQLLQFDLPDAWDGVGLDDQVVAVCCRRPDVGLGVEFVPAAEPSRHCVVFATGYVQTGCLLLCLGQLLFDLCLGFAQHISDDSLASLRIVAGGVPSLPAAVLALADVALTICSFLCHRYPPPFLISPSSSSIHSAISRTPRRKPRMKFSVAVMLSISCCALTSLVRSPRPTSSSISVSWFSHWAAVFTARCSVEPGLIIFSQGVILP